MCICTFPSSLPFYLLSSLSPLPLSLTSPPSLSRSPDDAIVIHVDRAEEVRRLCG